MGVHHGKLHPLWDIGWGDTSFDINAFKAHSKQKDIKQGDTFFYLNAFVAHSKQWTGFLRALRLFNMVTLKVCNINLSISYLIYIF